MSILVVNSLKNSTGSSPTLTWPTTDGTDGQVLQSSNNAGNLIFGGAQLEAGNGTNITFPASAADDRTFVTDANGALTATAAGTNPMNNEENQQGARLLDRYVISGSAGNVAAISLTVPTGYTNTDLNTIRTMKLVMRGMQTTSGSNYRPYITLLEQDGTNFFSGSGSNPNATWARFGTEGRNKNNANILVNTSSQASYLTRENVYRTSGSPDNEDFFSSTTTSSDQAYNAAACWNSVCYINCTTSPSVIAKTDYINQADQANYYNEQVYLGNMGQLASGNNTGRHPMGVKIQANNNRNWISGVVELYGVFKDGVVT